MASETPSEYNTMRSPGSGFTIIRSSGNVRQQAEWSALDADRCAVLCPVEFDLESLGDWSWVLVRRTIGTGSCVGLVVTLTVLHSRSSSGARRFSGGTLRPWQRSRTLLEKWRVPLDELLNVAVTHELAHMLCRERDEARTHAYAGQLSESGQVTCDEGTSHKPGR